MFEKTHPYLYIMLCVILAGCAVQLPESGTDSGSAQTRYPNIEQACGDRDGWSDPAPPEHVYGNVYMVGTCGITVLLITTSDGHFLIDGATDEAADGIAQNIRSLGFDPKDVRTLLATHEHLDHAGGLARLKRITGAQFAVREAAREAMASGLPASNDPQHGIHPAFPRITADTIIEDGDTVKIGNQAITVMATPGHSPGGTSYRWTSCDKGRCYHFVYADSLGAVSADAYRFSDHPDYVTTLRNSMARIEAITDCDILITPHPSQSNFFGRLAGEQRLINPLLCKEYASAARGRLEARIAQEAVK